MNIAVAPLGNHHLERLVEKIKGVDAQLTLLPWTSGEKAPAERIDTLLALGAVIRDDMEAFRAFNSFRC